MRSWEQPGRRPRRRSSRDGLCARVGRCAKAAPGRLARSERAARPLRPRSTRTITSRSRPSSAATSAGSRAISPRASARPVFTTAPASLVRCIRRRNPTTHPRRASSGQIQHPPAQSPVRHETPLVGSGTAGAARANTTPGQAQRHHTPLPGLRGALAAAGARHLFARTGRP
jgi:hypothetical protein